MGLVCSVRQEAPGFGTQRTRSKRCHDQGTLSLLPKRVEPTVGRFHVFMCGVAAQTKG